MPAAFRFHPRWPEMVPALKEAGLDGSLPRIIEMLERRDVELEEFMAACCAEGGASGPSATLVTATYTADDEVALNTIFDTAPFLADDIVLWMGANSGDVIGAPSAGLTVIIQLDSVVTSHGSGLAWARYGDIDDSDLLGWPGGADGQVVAVIRNLDPVAPISDSGFTTYFDDNPVPYGNCDVPANGGLLLAAWDYGHLGHSVTGSNLSSLPSTIWEDGGAIMSLYILRSFGEGNVAPTTTPAYDHIAGGDSHSGCVGLLRST